MAIDSAAKRRSIVGIQGIVGVGVTPDATPDQAWRQAVGWNYIGILADEPIEVDITMADIVVGSMDPIRVGNKITLGGL